MDASIIQMNLPPDVAYRWMTYDPAGAVGWEGWLSPEERQRVVGFTLPKRRREFVLGRAAARTLLAEHLDVEPPDVPLRVADDGAVEVVGPDLAVSITHSGGHAVAAVAPRPVGVDLERIAPRHPDLPHFLLHPDEHTAFEDLPLDPDRATILYWTLKEAALKALRTGFRLSPKKLRLDVDLAAQASHVHVADGPSLHARFEERHDFLCAVAYVPEPA